MVMHVLGNSEGAEGYMYMQQQENKEMEEGDVWIGEFVYENKDICKFSTIRFYFSSICKDLNMLFSWAETCLMDKLNIA